MLCRTGSCLEIWWIPTFPTWWIRPFRTARSPMKATGWALKLPTGSWRKPFVPCSSEAFPRISTASYIEQQLGISVPEFENNMRLKGYADAVQMIAMEGVIVTPAEVEAEYRKRNDKIKLDYIALRSVQVDGGNETDAGRVKAYFENNKNFFTVPENRDIQLIIADQAKVAESIQVSDAQIQRIL